jgi:aspartyl-tRNA(Asn)/glutamyl-tRNA(Gln) amidotransferase subunit C
MAIDRDTVRYVADLARIELDDRQLDLLSRQLEDIVSFIDKLNKVEVSGVKPTSHILPVANVFREDKAGGSLDSKETLENAPRKKEGFFSVPRVIE